MTLQFFKAIGYAPAILVPRAITLLVVVVFTHQLAPDQFGLYALLLVYGELLDATLLDWNRSGIRRFCYHGDSLNVTGLIPGASLVLAGGLVIGASVGAVIGASTDATATTEFFLLLMLYFAANGLLRFGLTILRVRERLTTYVLLECVRPPLGFLAAWFLVQTQEATYIPLALGLFGVTGLFTLPVFAATLRGVKWGSADWPTFRAMMGYAAPLLFVFLLAQLIMVSDRYLLNLLAGSAAVGMYAASYSLAKPALEILFNIVNLDAFPRMVKAYEREGSIAAQEVLRDSVSMYAFLCLPALVIITLLAEPLTRVLVSEAYRENAPAVMRVIALATFFAGFKHFVFDQIFHLIQKPMLQSYLLVPAVILNLALNLLLIPSFGILGSAWATLAGYALAAALSSYYSQRYIKILWPIRHLFWFTIATLCMGVTTYLIQHGGGPERLWFSLPIAGLMYLFVCWKANVNLKYTDTTGLD